MSKVSKVLSKELRGNLVVVMGVLIAGLMVVSGCSSQEAVAPSVQKPATQVTTPAPVEEKKNSYKDGSYDVVGTYTSPAGPEEIEVKLVLANGMVSDAEVLVKAENATSKKLQGMFVEGFEKEVVGKSIDEIDLDVVNGSSLTPKGFMDALAKIKEEAGAEA